jgi:hypothetical protein
MTFVFRPGIVCPSFDGELDLSEDDEQPTIKVSEHAPTASTKAPTSAALNGPIGPLSRYGDLGRADDIIKIT